MDPGVLKRRIIPKLLLKASRIGVGRRMVLVTTVGFERTIEVGDPVSQAKIYEAQAADELIFLDLDASKESRQPLIDVVHRAAEEIFMPITVGGGVRSTDDFRLLLSNGADKVSINSAAVEEPSLVRTAADAFGAQCVVVSIDYRIDGAQRRVWTHGGTIETTLDPVAWAEQAEALGAGELLLTCIDRDGSGRGLDVELLAQVTSAVTIPVIASGGCGLASHFVEGFKTGGAHAVAAGTFFCLRDQNPMQSRAHIRNAGIPIRVHT